MTKQAKGKKKADEAKPEEPARAAPQKPLPGEGWSPEPCEIWDSPRGKERVAYIGKMCRALGVNLSNPEGKRFAYIPMGDGRSCFLQILDEPIPDRPSDEACRQAPESTTPDVLIDPIPDTPEDIAEDRKKFWELLQQFDPPMTWAQVIEQLNGDFGSKYTVKHQLKDIHLGQRVDFVKKAQLALADS